MSNSSIASSNAFNFMSFVQNSVDPRTGQYTLAIELPELVGNDLSGPSLPLRLAYNPLNNQDSGFGVGWTLNLTEYVPASNMLTLHSGERYKVVGDSDDYAIPERKLESFHFHVDDAEHFRVVHKTGLVEFLELHGPQSNRVALPVRVEAASGHAITLEHTQNPYAENAPCLNHIKQAGPPLLKLTYESARVLIDLHPGAGPGGAPLARYELKLSSQGSPARRRIDAVVLPTDDKASWRFDYRDKRGLFLLSEVTTPSGAVETIAYDDDGHTFPGGGQLPDPLPRVTRHQIDPGADQPPMITTYDYTSNNFLGYGSGIQWKDDGEDHLYDSTDQYFTYGSTATQWVLDAEGEEQPLRTITRTFNRFHLLSKQVTNQDEHIQEIETAYHEVPGLNFARQPNNFQLPYSTTRRWKRGNQLREEVLITRYDEHGNLTLKSEVAVPRYDAQGKLLEAPTLAGTIYTRHSYYPAQGDGDDCPPDPYGFVRTTKEETRYPATDAEGQAQTLSNRYYYRKFDTLGGSQSAEYWLLSNREERVQQGDEPIRLQHSERKYLHHPDNPLLHGRLDYQEDTLYCGETQKTSTTRYFHSLVNDDQGAANLLRTKRTFQGHDRLEQVTEVDVSRHTGSVMRQKNQHKVEVLFRYDALDRLLSETLPADGTTRQYSYTSPGVAGQACKSVTDAQGVVTRTWFDGANRTLWEELEVEHPTRNTRAWHKVYACDYDGVGNLLKESRFDLLEDDELGELPLALTTHFEYDAWNDRSKTIGPDGVAFCQERSPFGATGDIITTWQERQSAPGERRGVQVSELNVHGKPISDSRLDKDGKTVGKQTYLYDGLARSVEQTQTLRDPLDDDKQLALTQRHEYDAWDRIFATERPNRSVLTRTFASHSQAELTEALHLLERRDAPPQAICKRVFDGLERMTQFTVGTRVEKYHYRPDQVLVHKHERASGKTATFAYRPELTLQPTGISTGEEAQPSYNFAYDRKDAAITKANAPTGERAYSYTDQGFLLKESWAGQNEGENYALEYTTSLQGLPLLRSGGGELPTRSRYDDKGRLRETHQGQLKATFSYDEDGRLQKTVTTHEGNQRSVTCDVLYDEHGREKTRTLTLDDGTVDTLELVWRDDDSLHQRIRKRGDALLLQETFSYDALSRLTMVEYDGSDLPANSVRRRIKKQVFGFDQLDNLTRCQTRFADGNTDNATFALDELNPFQLKSVSHTLQPDYPQTQAFSYDADGNLNNDEWGNLLSYDDRSRLCEVRSADGKQSLASYRYDGHDHLVGVRHGSASEVIRRFQGYRLSGTVQDDVLVQYLCNGETSLGLQHAQSGSGRLLLSDNSGSVLGEYADGQLHAANQSVYGERAEDEELQSLLAFNGEVREPGFGWYLLGRGYRAYNPGLMRFHSPDALAPEEAGINPYLYALGNPISWRDPTGHRGQSALGRGPMPGYEDPYEAPEQPGSAAMGWIFFGIAALALVASVVVPVAGALAAGTAIAAAFSATTIVGIAVQTAGVIMMGVSLLADVEDGVREGLMWGGSAVAGIGSMMSMSALMGGVQQIAKKVSSSLAGLWANIKGFFGAPARAIQTVAPLTTADGVPLRPTKRYQLPRASLDRPDTSGVRTTTLASPSAGNNSEQPTPARQPPSGELPGNGSLAPPHPPVQPVPSTSAGDGATWMNMNRLVGGYAGDNAPIP
ncbi:RHS repeat-associated core domain-containing protein [Pseudomonas sp. NPDC089758]|uniref:RHS repeat-associated core domain-containing protein n=1 Tax=Pseudomonas sp. NPDC089758 TaxID=3364473 RepID=UPI00382E068C